MLKPSAIMCVTCLVFAIVIAGKIAFGQQARVERFVCELPGTTYTVTLDQARAHYVVTTLPSPLAAGGVRNIALPRLPTSEGFTYQHNDLKFSGVETFGILETGAATIPCRAQFGLPDDLATMALNIEARSLGGRLREGPGTAFASVGSLVAQQQLLIVRNTGVRFNAHDWFEVRVSGRSAYAWGGTICLMGERMPGLTGPCAEQQPAQIAGPPRQPTPPSAAQNWMAVAVDRRGGYGHGRANDAAAAQSAAVQMCGNANCEVHGQPVQTPCQAFADSFERGYYFGVGTGKTESEATSYALAYCTGDSGRECVVRYQYCQ